MQLVNINEETTGDVFIKRNTQYNDLKANNVTVEENITTRIFGTIKGLLTLKKGSIVYLHGIIYGSMHNEGGELHIFNKEGK
ncbi:MAG: hypothetical protein ACT4ON_06010 [Bacteroidota bacterium]